MWIFRVNRFLKNTFRLIGIILIILKHTIKNWLYSGPLRKIVDPRGRNLTTSSERIRLMVEDLGPTFVKFGQILADRPDLATDALRNELKKLQSSARPFDDEQAISIIEEELGEPLDNLFSEFNRRHIASASIGQVYRGTLLNGEEVVIKVQRPGIKPKIKLDLILIKILAHRVAVENPELKTFNLEGFVEDFGNIMMKELDFTNEAANMLRFTYMFKDDERCYIPKVYNDLCTQKVLIMEYVEGIRPDDVYMLKKDGFDTQIIAENGVHIVLTMILKYGFFHADPHPGNIFIRGNNQFVLIDYGMCASLKPKQINALINFMMGFAKKDSHKITKALLELTETSYMKEAENLEFEIDELIKKYSYMSYDQVDISGVMNEAFRAIVRYGVRIPSSLFMLVKTLVTIQNVAEVLNARISIPSMIEPYAREKIMERFSWENIKSKIVNSAEDYLYLVEKLPKDIREIVSNFKHEGIKFTIGLGDEGRSDKKVKQHVNRLAFVFLTGLMMICSTLLMIYDGEQLAVRWFFYTSLVITVLTTLRLFIKSSFS